MNHGPRLLAVAILTSTIALASAAECFGAGLQRARFNVTISGTFTSTGSETDTGCHYEDVPGEVVQFTKTTTVTDRARFSSHGRGIVEVSSLGGPPLAGMIKIPSGTAALTRSRASNTPRPCSPSGLPDRCGSKSRTVRFGVWGRTTRSALGYELRNRTGPVYPDDPFTECPLVGSQISWGKLRPRPTKVSRAKLFDRRVRRIVVNGHYTVKEPRSGGRRYSSESAYTLRYKITMKRRRSP